MAKKLEFESVPGGVNAAVGYLAWSAACGIKPGADKSKQDLALIFSESPSVAAAVFTTNQVKAAPVRVSQAHLKTRNVRAVLLNSGNANACTGAPGLRAAERMAAAAGAGLGVHANQVLIGSTGRIGVSLPVEKIEAAFPDLTKADGRSGSTAAARAIMTSDTFPKESAVRVRLGGKRVTIGGIAKGAGMINPNMATMLAVLTTDARIEKALLQRALKQAAEHSFNCITVDGDMSTNDTVFVLANGRAGGPLLTARGADYERFTAALTEVCRHLARQIVEDGEGVTKFVEVRVSGAASARDARLAAEAIANSTLVKCAWFGGDPNWGRIMDALGYCGAKLHEDHVEIFYGGLCAVRQGVASKVAPARIQEVVRRKKFMVEAKLHLGTAEHVVFTTDLSTEYVKLNMGE